jgi:hypothetical protein
MITPITYRPMKFWEVVSAFRDEREILEAVFSSDKWRNDYLTTYLAFDKIVDRQDRQILDAPVPVELTREIAAQYPATYDLYPTLKHPLSQEPVSLLRSHTSEKAFEEENYELTALEVHDRFGGYAIEEVAEYGSCYVAEKTSDSQAKCNDNAATKANVE